MYYLIYISSAVKQLNYDELSSLLREARESNRERGITGLLLYQDGTFMQMLEGERAAVQELFGKISKDSRHVGVHVVHEGEIERRNFDDWSMGFFNMDKAGEHPGYSDYIDEHLALKTFNRDAQDARDFMLKFNRVMR